MSEVLTGIGNAVNVTIFMLSGGRIMPAVLGVLIIAGAVLIPYEIGRATLWLVRRARHG